MSDVTLHSPAISRTTFLLGLLFLVSCACADVCSAQQKPLERSFAAGAAHRYRVRLIVRSELEGQRPVSTGSRTSIQPFTRAAEFTLSWRATQKIAGVMQDGSAGIEEALDEFEPAAARGEPTDEEAKKLGDALGAALARWTVPRTLRFRETPSGQMLGLGSDGVPALGESAPPLLTLWLLRALRPTATLPARPIVFGERWQEPRVAPLESWIDVQGAESGEWMDAPGGVEPAVRLHVVQQISGRLAPSAELPDAGPAQARFHGESLSSISLLNARLLSAERSAMREITRVLGAVSGLAQPPQFRARLAVQVQIEDCHDNPCLAFVAAPARGKRGPQ